MGFDLGFLEILVIFVVGLLVLGPERLPEYAKKFGKMLRDFRKMTKNLTGEMTRGLDLEDEFDDLKNSAQGLKGSLDAESQKIKNALDMEADEIAKTIDTEVKGIKKTLNEETADLTALLEKESLEFDKTAKEMKSSLDSEGRELSKALNEGVKEISKTINVDNPKKEKTAKSVSTVGSTRAKKKDLETPEALDVVESPKPQKKSSAVKAAKENPTDKNDSSEEAEI